MRINKAVLAYELARREMRQKNLAELSGVSRATLSAISGGKNIAADTGEKIAQALNVPLEKLIEKKEALQ
jgi:transcriptional regulator with XRE-family HTH domain